jgi:hypothetical protein
VATTPTPRSRILIVAAVDALLLVGALTGLAVVPSDDDQASDVASGASTTAPPDTTTTTPVSEAATSTTAAVGTKKAKGGSPATTAPKRAGSASGPSGEGPPPAMATPPRDGTYVHKSHMTMDGAPNRDDEAKSTYSTTSSAPGDVRQKVTSSAGNGSGSGATMGGDQSAEVSWRADGVYQRSDSSAVKCNPPEQLRLKQPVAAGTTWSTVIDCTFSIGGASGTTHAETTSKVVRSTTATVGGRTVGAWEITSSTKAHSTFKSTQGSGESDTTGTTTELFVSAFGLPAHQDIDTTTTAMGRTVKAHIVLDLQSLDPT